MPPHPAEVTFSVTYEDLLLVGVRQFLHDRPKQLILLAFIGFGAFKLLRQETADLIWLGAGFVIYLILIAGYIALNASLLAKELEKADNRISVRIDAEHFYSASQGDYFPFPWSAITGLQETGTHLLVWLPNNTVTPIRKDAFTSEADAHQFFKTAYTYWKAKRP